MRLGIVASRFNEEICGKLLDGARAEAQKLKAEVTVISVPGALEIPLACNGWRSPAASTRWSRSAR
jgi:6,7-dimethyl-8-ribityllumazine synthase